MTQPKSYTSSRPCPFRLLPSPLEYLQLIECELGTLYSVEKQPFVNSLAELADGALSIQAILEVASHLRRRPRLLYGLNCLIRPHCRIECSTTTDEVRYFVLVSQRRSRILCFTALDLDANEDFSLPSSCEDVLRLLNSNSAWERVFGLCLRRQWLECFAQVLQELIDDPAVDDLCKSAAYKRLIHLARDGILPPSIFTHFVIIGNTRPSQIMNNTEYVASGGNCDVHRVSIRSTHTCLRVLRQTQLSEVDKMYRTFCMEIIVWRQLKHPNIAPFIGATLEIFPGRCCFILPWFKNGSIMFYLKKHPNHDKFQAIHQIVDAVDYLHSLNPPITHKDIKGANILVDDQGSCVLSDFGLSGSPNSQRASSGKGTIYWMPPELFVEEYDACTTVDSRPRDIYSLGCTIYEIFTGGKPSAIMFSVLQGKPAPLPPTGQWTAEELDLWCIVGMCVEAKPARRLPITVIKAYLQRNNRLGVAKPTNLCHQNAQTTRRLVGGLDSPSVRDWIQGRLSYHALISGPADLLPPLKGVCRRTICSDMLSMGMGWV